MEIKKLNKAQNVAENWSGCLKVKVGCIVTNSRGKVVGAGANRVLDNSCKDLGCHRINLYGNDAKNHRLPSDCKAIHSEIDALTRLGRIKNGVMYVTRYPCEACARAIVASGKIKKVVYGRQQEIPKEVKDLFKLHHIEVVWFSDWFWEDTTR